MEAARIEKEKEIARLRAQQERAKDKQAEKVNCTLLILKKTAAKTAQKKNSTTTMYLFKEIWSLQYFVLQIAIMLI